MVSDVYFAFGPEDTFLFNGPFGYESRRVDDRFFDKVGEDEEWPELQCLTIGEDGASEFFVWIDEEDGEHAHMSPRLKGNAHLRAFWHTHRTDTRLAIGASDHYVVWSMNGDGRMEGTFDFGGLQCHGKLQSSRSRTEHVSLGVDNSLFVLREDGRFHYDLKENYHTLETILEELDQGDIEFLALNPYRVEQFFLLTTDGIAFFRVCPSIRGLLLNGLTRHRIRPVDMSPQRSSSRKGGAAQGTPRDGFWKELAKQVALQGCSTMACKAGDRLVGGAGSAVKALWK